MKAAFQFILFLAFTLDASAFVPDHAERVSANAFTLAGSGVRAKGSEESLALACEVEDCSSLRFVYFDGHGGTYYFGERFAGYATKDRVKDIADEAFTIRNATEHRRASRGVWLMIGLGAGSFAIVAITTVPITIFLIASFIIAATPDTQHEFFKKHDVIGVLKNRKVTRAIGRVESSKVFLDKDGWNWSVDPKKVKTEKFCLAVAAIDHPESMDNEYSRNQYVDRCMNDLN